MPRRRKKSSKKTPARNDTPSPKKDFLRLMGMHDKKYFSDDDITYYKKALNFCAVFMNILSEIISLSIIKSESGEFHYLLDSSVVDKTYFIKLIKYYYKNLVMKEELKKTKKNRYIITTDNSALMKQTEQYVKKLPHYINYYLGETWVDEIVSDLSFYLNLGKDCCCICMEPFVESNNPKRSNYRLNAFCNQGTSDYIYKLKCGHCFHRDCFSKFALSCEDKVLCPLCRNYDVYLYYNINLTIEKYKSIYNECMTEIEMRNMKYIRWDLRIR